MGNLHKHLGGSGQYKWTVLWGFMDLNGNWHPNPHLKMSVEQQYRENIKSGAIPLGTRIILQN